MSKQAARQAESAGLSHNLLGQRLGRKGRGTRDRILAATQRLLADPDTPLSLSAVAREASLAMTTLYLYFGDLTELLLAVLEPIMASAEESYIGQLREHWPDAAIGERCLAFVDAFHAFWERNARALHLRNSYGAGDARMVKLRIDSATPLINLLIAQMEAPAVRGTLQVGMASALITGLERIVTVSTDANLTTIIGGDAKRSVSDILRGQARLLELGVRDGRAARAGKPAGGS